MDGRDLLKLSAGAALLPLGGEAWAAAPGGGSQRLIVIVLRGAVDGLNVVIPCSEQAYYEVRPTIAIGRPGTNDGALPLDGRFGLHPASPLCCRSGATKSSLSSMPRARPTRRGRISTRSCSSRPAPPGAPQRRTHG